MNVNTSQNDSGVVKGDFKQCTLVRKINYEVVQTVVLIPLKLAKIGKILEIKNDEGIWIEWLVLSISNNIQTDPIDSRVLIRAHRRATGDSLPKVGK
ncbi:MAG: hypothetical protein M0R17_00225 [Candidatus Omnitrophica bacterium]|jgi:hypothetical protein|nr:hypothetical protein [Candidatus Omnitrophota bacterium]